jgi:5-methylcytosine-specific restriction endonuclease McrA
LLESRQRRKAAERRRRRLLATAARESYTLAEIAVRDGHVCGICRKRVRMNLAVPHPEAPTIDHLIPVSEGGDDVKANVRLAHFLCNSTRGVGKGEVIQLALVG